MMERQHGKFRKGESGNPGGRPKGAYDIQKVAREHTVEALDILARIMRKGRPLEQIQAAKIILERAWGKPCQGVEISRGDNADTGTIINITLSDEWKKTLS